jgi:tetratricopeptide (TPR) repeat protein
MRTALFAAYIILPLVVPRYAIAGDWADCSSNNIPETIIRGCTAVINSGNRSNLYNAYLRRGQFYTKNKEYKAAISDFSEAIKINPENYALYGDRGYAYICAKDYDLARIDLDSAVRLKSTYGYYYYLRGIVLREKKQYDQSITDFAEAIRLEPKKASHYHERGISYHRNHEYARAIADYDEAIRLDAKNIEYYLSRGESFIEIKKYESAINDYNKALTIEPKNARIFTQRGEAYFYKGDYHLAIAEFNKLIKLDHKEYTYYVMRGAAFFNAGDYDKAIADFSEAIRLNSTEATAYSNRCEAYKDKGDYDRAIVDCNQALSLDPKYANAYLHRAKAHMGKGSYDRAISDYNQAVQLNPTDARVYHARGNAYADNGQIESAIADFNQALRIDPSYWDAAESRRAALRKNASRYLAVRPGFALADIRKRFSRSSVFVAVKYETVEDGAPASGCKMGSGFVISEEGYVITSYHLFTDNRGQPFKRIVKILGKIAEPFDCGSPIGDVIALDQVIANPDADSILLKLTTSRQFSPVSTCFPFSVDDGSKLYVLGFPLGLPLDAKEVIKSNQTKTRWQISGQFDEGNSGGPVFNSHGNLIGIVHSHIKDTSISFVVPFNHFAAFFQYAGVALKQCK